MQRTMHAAVMEAPGQPLKLRQVPVPSLERGEVLVATRTTGLCGTDLHILAGHGYIPPLPHILGHEPAGVVTAVGPGVEALRPGDRVIPHLFFSCGSCDYCRRGCDQQCSRMQGILGVLSPGALAEYFKAPARNLFVLPAEIPFATGGLIADAVVTSVHAAKRGHLVPGSPAIVIGVGGVGLCLIQVLVAFGMRVSAWDISEAKLALAAARGARPADPQQSAVAVCVFDCVGSSDSLARACRWVMNGGRVVVIGEHGDPPSVSSTEIAQRELEIVGSRNGTRQDLVEALGWVQSGAVKPPVAARFPLAEVNAALELMRRGTQGRVVVEINPAQD